MLSAGAALLRPLPGLIRHRVRLSGLVALLWLIRLILLIHGFPLLMIRRLIVHGADTRFDFASRCRVAHLFRLQNRPFPGEKSHCTQSNQLMSRDELNTRSKYFLSFFGCCRTRLSGTELFSNRPGHRRLFRSRMQRRHRLNQRKPCLFSSRGIMPNPTRYNEKLAWITDTGPPSASDRPMRSKPRSTRNISSSCSWLCQGNSPWTFATLMYWLFTCPTTRGDQSSSREEQAVSSEMGSCCASKFDPEAIGARTSRGNRR